MLKYIKQVEPIDWAVTLCTLSLLPFLGMEGFTVLVVAAGLVYVVNVALDIQYSMLEEERQARYDELVQDFLKEQKEYFKENWPQDKKPPDKD